MDIYLKLKHLQIQEEKQPEEIDFQM